MLGIIPRGSRCQYWEGWVWTLAVNEHPLGRGCASVRPGHLATAAASDDTFLAPHFNFNADLPRGAKLRIVNTSMIIRGRVRTCRTEVSLALPCSLMVLLRFLPSFFPSPQSFSEASHWVFTALRHSYIHWTSIRSSFVLCLLHSVRCQLKDLT